MLLLVVPCILEQRCSSCFLDRMQRLLQICHSGSWLGHALLYKWKLILLFWVWTCVCVCVGGGWGGGGGGRGRAEALDSLHGCFEARWSCRS